MNVFSEAVTYQQTVVDKHSPPMQQKACVRYVNPHREVENVRLLSAKQTDERLRAPLRGSPLQIRTVGN